MVTKTAYAAIRRDIDSGKEYIDIDTVEYLADMSKAEVHKTDREIPGWAKSNPLLRIAQVQITEIGG